jgi:hypothetical protein
MSRFISGPSCSLQLSRGTGGLATLTVTRFWGVSALILDLDERGLLQDVAVLMGGEFGRTPRIGDQTPSEPLRGVPMLAS